MADGKGGKGAALARRSRPAQKIVSPRNKVNVALPLSMIRAEEPTTMRLGDWISLAGLVVSVIGFSVAIRELIRIAHASEADQMSHRASPARLQRGRKDPGEYVPVGRGRLGMPAPPFIGQDDENTPAIRVAGASLHKTVPGKAVDQAGQRALAQVHGIGQVLGARLPPG